VIDYYEFDSEYGRMTVNCYLGYLVKYLII